MSKHQNSQIVSVKGVAAMKFSSGVGEQVKGKPLPDGESARVFVAVAGYNPPSRAFVSPHTPPTTKGITSAE
jgi:hypothetical protein